MVYTKADIRSVVAFARDRGVRVIPEIDVPGKFWIEVQFWLEKNIINLRRLNNLFEYAFQGYQDS